MFEIFDTYFYDSISHAIIFFIIHTFIALFFLGIISFFRENCCKSISFVISCFYSDQLFCVFCIFCYFLSFLCYSQLYLVCDNLLMFTCGKSLKNLIKTFENRCKNTLLLSIIIYYNNCECKLTQIQCFQNFGIQWKQTSMSIFVVSQVLKPLYLCKFTLEIIVIVYF